VTSNTGHRLRNQYVYLAIITVAAAVLRLYRLTAHGLTLDEGYSAHLGQTSTAGFVATVWNSEFNMVLYYALLRAWMHIGHSEFVIRLLGVLFAVATVPASYFLACRLFHREWTPLLAAMLLAIHPFHVALSRDARSYSLVVLLVTLASLYFLRLLQSPSRVNCTSYALICAAAVYSHFFALLVVASHTAALLFYPNRPPWKCLLIALLVSIVLLLPLAAFLLHHGEAGHVSWVAPLHSQQVADVLYSLTLSRRRSLTYIALWIAALFAAVSSTREEAWPYRFTAIWLFIPILITLLISIGRPLFVSRFLAICIPAGVLLAASGVIVISRWSRYASLAILALTVFYSSSNIRHYFQRPEYTETWREASAYLLSRAQPGDEVVVLPGTGPPFEYYLERNSKSLLQLRILPSGADAKRMSLPQNVWFLGSLTLTPKLASETEAFAQAYRGQYCPEPPQPAPGSVQVWQFRMCAK